MPNVISEELLCSLVDVQNHNERLTQQLQAIPDEAALLRILRRYAKWNSYFAAGVAQLVANIANCDLLLEPGWPLALADRSQYIASFFFDAARDEFDDHINRERDPHRSMAQATLYALSRRLPAESGLDVLNEVEPDWLKGLCKSVVTNYNGFVCEEELPRIFVGIGYHLGSELLADQEFTLIDRFLRANMPEVVEYLKHKTEIMAGANHRAYAWIGLHSGEGGAAEADHFAWALDGANKAIEYSNFNFAHTYIKIGLQVFAEDQLHFISRVSELPK